MNSVTCTMPLKNDSQVTVEYANDWQSDRAEYQSQIDKMLSWIKTNREQSNNEINEQYDIIDINSLNEMQRLAYDIVNSHW